MNLSALKMVIKPFMPAFRKYLDQMAAPVDQGGYLQPGDNMVGITLYQDSQGVNIAAMSYRFDSTGDTPVITVTSINPIGNFESLK